MKIPMKKCKVKKFSIYFYKFTYVASFNRDIIQKIYDLGSIFQNQTPPWCKMPNFSYKNLQNFRKSSQIS